MAEPLTNGMTEAALRAFVHDELDFRRKKKAIGDAHKSMRAHVKTFAVDLADFDEAIKQMLAEDGGDLFVKKLEERHKLMVLLGLPVTKRFAAGDQLALPLPEPKSKNGKSKPFREGANAHLYGKEETDIPHSINTVEGQDWLEGFRYSVALFKKGREDIKLLEKGEDPEKPAAAKGTLAARTPKPAEAYAGEPTAKKSTATKPKKPKKTAKKSAEA